MTRAIDSHCHLQMVAYDKDRKEVIEKTLKAGVDMIVVGTDLESSRQAVEIAKQSSGVWATVGLHPEEALKSDWRSQLVRICELIDHPKVVAIGEIGFDKRQIEKKNSREALQIQATIFDFFVQESQKAGKPLIIHIRDAFELFISRLPALKKSQIRGVVHCFSGSASQAKKIVEAGFLLGFTGLITFKPDWDKIIKKLPLESILIETDAPFLTPIPYRGKRNEPSYVVEVAKKIAQLKNIACEEVMEQTRNNTYKLFGIAC